jgi:hypothetical protein
MYICILSKRHNYVLCSENAECRLGDYEGRRWYMPLLCRDRMRDAIANQLINKLSRSIKSIHLMEVIFGILIPSMYLFFI